jgi:hypothetical protein
LPILNSWHIVAAAVAGAVAAAGAAVCIAFSLKLLYIFLVMSLLV